MATACKAPTLLQFETDNFGFAKFYSSPPDPYVKKIDGLIDYGNRTLSLAWGGAAPGTANAITGYQIVGTVADTVAGLGTWGTILPLITVASNKTADATQYSFGDVGPGKYFKLRIRTIGAAGSSYYSAWFESVVYRVNQAPGTPTIWRPSTTKTCHNPKPRLLISMPNDYDGSVDQPGTSYATMRVRGSDIDAINNDVFDNYRSLVLRKATPAEASGTITLTFKAADCLPGGYGDYGGDATVNVNYVAPTYTDTMEAGTTRIKAVHITELRTMIDTMRDYYGLSAYSWAASVVAGTSLRNWYDHVLELRSAIEDIANTVNSWDTGSYYNGIVLPTWIPLTSRLPRADVMQQLRDIIPQL